MPIPQEALDLENRNIGVNGEPTLAKAYEILWENWQSGNRDRELGLHLMFLAWFGQDEPSHLTGFVDSDEARLDLMKFFNEIHSYFEPHINQDAEMLYAFGLAANLSWFMFPLDTSKWESRSFEYQKRYRELVPEGFDPEIFHGRGAYGDFYGRHAVISASPNGY